MRILFFGSPLERLPQEEPNPTGNNVFIAAIEALDVIGFNIDEININSGENDDVVVMTAREWVFRIRENQKEARQKKLATATQKGLAIGVIEYQRPLSSHTPPHKEPSQFMETYKSQ